MAQRNLAVIGGGPKAAALAAKAYCLRQLGVPIRVSIFEKDEIGAAWDGRHGYTDGNQRLCTPAERDLGFPYDTGIARSVAVQMQADFSWAAYLSTRRGPDYSDWVSRGRKPPFHRDFADYLRYAVERSNADVFHGRVTGLRIEDGLWTIDQVDRDSRNRIATKGFHGTVVTGPGPAARRVRRIDDPRVFTGETFWGKLGAVRRLLRRARNQIVIVGGGGTAAAVAAWLVRNSWEALRIVLLHDQATLFTRTANFFENRIFDNEDAWQAMSEKDRQTFVQRLNRGVVWESVSEILADASQLALETGRATAIEHGEHPSGARPDLVVRFSSHSKGTTSHTADIVVDAAGFDPWWFRELVPAPLRAELPRRLRPELSNAERDTAKQRAGELESTMAPDLSLALPDWPKLHVPMLSQAVGPGYMSLMSLGGMADRILNPYFKALTQEDEAA